ncbi:MAG: glucan biosynthesis protein G [Planctomycetes bacterium]|nr:glucan biosynthesis protein G [Planctomycetota bacterium]MCC7172288.1 glucan biosynthesis protein G [Planctomycetota bacterium]
MNPQPEVLRSTASCVRRLISTATVALTAAGTLIPAPVAATDAPPRSTYATVVERARAVAATPYVAPAVDALPKALAELDYDRYRSIRFAPDHALWKSEGLPFQLQFFHCGFFFKEPVHVSTVDAAGIAPVPFSTGSFQYGAGGPPADLPEDLGFAGFRVHAALNRPDYLDELVAFLGASYFRVLGKGQVYGLSARGLALDCGEDSGEEFPRFTQFFVEKPAADSTTLTVVALLDSRSVAGAYEFTFSPGDSTRTVVRASLFPRTDLDKPGLAPLTSMFLFGENRVRFIPDFRPEVHDSDGLSLRLADGTNVWRPLDNPPQRHRITRIAADGVTSFGLAQRDREFDHYQDLETQQERRPSYVIVPRAGFEHGHVELVEIPTSIETNDNVVAYFVPAQPLRGGESFEFAYELVATTADDARRHGGVVIATRIDPDVADDEALFVVDFDGDESSSREPVLDARRLRGEVRASRGEVRSIVVQQAESGRVRLSFRIHLTDREPVELHARLLDGDVAATETWTYLADLP